MGVIKQVKTTVKRPRKKEKKAIFLNPSVLGYENNALPLQRKDCKRIYGVDLTTETD